jgi:hypothetical protein
MAFDFPSSPTPGQLVAADNKATYVWDSAKWTIAPAAQAGPRDTGRNLLHNPQFNIQQRGVGPWTGAGNYTADRWSMNFNGGTYSASLIALTDADRLAIGDEEATFAWQGTVAGTAGLSDSSFIEQRIENVRRTANKTVTLSFWARATSGTPQVGINLGQLFGNSGGGTSAPVWFTTGSPVTLSTVWTRYALTFVLLSVAGKTFNATPTDGLSVRFYQSSGSSSNAQAGNIGAQSFTLQLWGMQFEIGSVATPLEKLDPRIDLANCQRFFVSMMNLIGGYNVATGGAWIPSLFPVTMRASPTIAYGTPTVGNASGLAMNQVTSQTVVHQIAAVATGGMWAQFNYTASADF